MSRSQSPTGRKPTLSGLSTLLPALVVVLLSQLSVPLAASAKPVGDALSQAQELIDEGRADAALPLLDRLIKAAPNNARAWLARSTAHFMLDQTLEGRKDLDRALKIDPSLRQGWLNRAALAIADHRLNDAYQAFLTAEKLDPKAPDNDLNIGTVLLLEGKVEQATTRFNAYLAKNPGSAQSEYLVASNYAMAGYAALSIAHLKQAIGLDEKIRVRARTDPNFSDLADNPGFQRLLSQDNYVPPPGAHMASQAYGTAYQGGQGQLLRAVLDAVQLSGAALDRRVEVTKKWALLWSDVRIKVTNSSDGHGLVQVSAPANAFTPEEWSSKTGALFRQIALYLATTGPRREAPAPPSR